MKQGLMFLTVCTVVLLSCSKNPPVINIPPAFEPLMNHGWYLAEKRDTTYSKTGDDTIRYTGSYSWSQSIIKGRQIPDSLDADSCIRKTLFYFNTDGTFSQKNCSGQINVLASWKILYDTAQKGNFVYFTETHGNFYDPFLSRDCNCGGFDYPLTLVDTSQIVVHDAKLLVHFMRNLNDSTKIITNPTFIITNRTFKHP
jgi:hypothetical protein